MVGGPWSLVPVAKLLLLVVCACVCRQKPSLFGNVPIDERGAIPLEFIKNMVVPDAKTKYKGTVLECGTEGRRVYVQVI